MYKYVFRLPVHKDCTFFLSIPQLIVYILYPLSETADIQFTLNNITRHPLLGAIQLLQLT